MKKKILLLSISIICSITSFSQEKATLTKGETINYLQKKLNEAVGLSYHEDNYKITIIKNEISLDGEKIRIYYEEGKLYNPETRTVWPTCSRDYDQIIIVEALVNPILLQETFFEMDKENRVVGFIQCNLSSAGSRYYADVKRCSGSSWEIEHWIPQSLRGSFAVHYSKEDPTNYQKIEKAFKHLRDLYKAEDDPFGN